MTNKVKIMVGDDSADYGVICANSLKLWGSMLSPDQKTE